MNLTLSGTRTLTGASAIEQAAGRSPSACRMAPESRPVPGECRPRIPVSTETAGGAWSTFAVVALHLLEQVLWLIQPLMLGVAINGLVQSSWSGLLLFAGAHVLYLLAGAAQRGLTPRLQPVRETATVPFPAAAHAGVPLQAEEWQVRGDIPRLVRLACGTAGSLLLLSWYDPLLVPWCLAFLLPAWLLFAAFGETDTGGRGAGSASLTAGTPAEPGGPHLRYAVHRIRQADRAAARFSLTELFGLGVLVAALVQYCFACRFDNGPTVTAPAAGDVFAVVSYLLLYLSCAAELPAAVRQRCAGGPPSLQSRIAARSSSLH